MRWHKQLLITGTVLVAVAAMTAAAPAGTSSTSSSARNAQHARHVGADDQVQLGLTPSSAQLTACMPGAQLTATVALSSDQQGFDRLEISGHDLPPSRDFTIF